jgi:hypothetical protein
MMLSYLGYPIRVGKTDLGWSSPANPFLEIPVPLSTTKAFAFKKLSSSAIFLIQLLILIIFLIQLISSIILYKLFL